MKLYMKSDVIISWLLLNGFFSSGDSTLDVPNAPFRDQLQGTET